jgi:nicotinate-nucleotide adenylyltransferase
MRIAILGGSFDPPHWGHLFIASQVKEFLEVDQVWLMPLYQHAFDKKVSSVEHRLAMTKLLEGDSLKVSTYEIDQQKTSYTIETLDGLAAKYREHTFSWILGSDQLAVFYKYKDWQDIIARHSVIVFPREYLLPHLEEEVKNALQLQTIPPNVIVLQNSDLILTNISSTKIRDRVKNNRSIHNYVPEKVEEYIKEHDLYSV